MTGQAKSNIRVFHLATGFVQGITGMDVTSIDRETSERLARILKNIDRICAEQNRSPQDIARKRAIWENSFASGKRFTLKGRAAGQNLRHRVFG